MIMDPRVLVGTLHTIENELDRCTASILAQRGCHVEHFVIEGESKRVAHDELYRTFMRRAGEFDLFVKVDADMVIQSPSLFARIAERFGQDPTIDQLEIAVHDFFTDGHVMGLNSFRNTVRWPERGSSLFTDATPVPADRHAQDHDHLAPAALHCPDPTAFQAFHFGVHKALKLLEAVAEGRSRRVQRHWHNMEATWRHFLRRGDPRLGLASLGSELALRGLFRPEHVDYSDPFARGAFRRYENDSSRWLARRCRVLRLLNRRFLPSRIWLARLERSRVVRERDPRPAGP